MRPDARGYTVSALSGRAVQRRPSRPAAVHIPRLKTAALVPGVACHRQLRDIARLCEQLTNCLTRMKKQDSLEVIREQLHRFAVDRDWEQFHSPKNLAMALSAECGELLEQFMWLDETQSASLAPEQTDAVALELADIMIYLIRLADCLDVDLLDAVRRKAAINEQRYPVEKVRGRAIKYDKL